METLLSIFVALGVTIFSCLSVNAETVYSSELVALVNVDTDIPDIYLTQLDCDCCDCCCCKEPEPSPPIPYPPCPIYEEPRLPLPCPDFMNEERLRPCIMVESVI